MVPLPSRLVRCSALLLLPLIASCGSGKGEPGPGPTPASIKATSGNQQTGVAGTSLAAPLAVVVADKDGRALSNQRVEWDVSAGSGTVQPVASMTNANGIATTTWTLGTTAGTATVTARVSGLNPVAFTANVLPGSAASVVATPDFAFLEIGDTIRVRATVRDQYGNSLSNQAVSFTSLESSVATVGSTGLVTAVAMGEARIVAEAGARADTVPVSVGPPGSGVCGNIVPRTLSVGEVFVPSQGSGGTSGSMSVCITAPDALTAEFALTLVSTAPNFGSASSVDVQGIGTRAPAGAAIRDYLQEEGRISADPESASASQQWHMAMQRSARKELDPLVETARSWQRDITARSQSDIPGVAKLTAVAVGDVIKLNANANQGCTNPDTRNGRVVAVSNRAMVVADNDNPSGGYTDADYKSILATFDTLVFPMDTSAFGSPSNISQYGKIILFYTRAVNALTPANAGYTIGGFFYARDLYPKTARDNKPACGASNENEMFYLLVPDPNGTINGNKRSKEDVTILNITTIAHELQHLINSSRRLYVNASATASEETWLDEGLSHIAEELLYLRVSGFSQRQNLTLGMVAANNTRIDQFRNFVSQNFSRFYDFLIAPEANSPYAPNDSLATRGATWNFLRYAAGRQGENREDDFFHSLVNSQTAGVANLQSVLSGSQFADYLRDWTIALIADDYTSATTSALGAPYTIPAWNFRSIYPGLRFGSGAALGVYPIATRTLRSNEPQRIKLAGGTSSYLRFSLASNSRALVTISSNGAAPPSALRYAFVRMK